MKTLYVIHGWTYTVAPWQNTIKLLKEHDIEIKMLHVPGLTEPSDKVFTISDYAKWADQEIPDGAVALGHSNGGRILLNLCAKKPEVLKVLSIMANRNKVEDDFRIMKTNFDARPVRHRLPPRIQAHFMICYAALLVHRLLEKLLDDSFPDHFTIDDITETMRNVSIAPIDPKFCTSLYTGSKILSSLQTITGIHLDMKYYRPKDLDILIKKLVRK